MRMVNQFLFSLLLLFSTLAMAEFDDSYQSDGRSTSLSEDLKLIQNNSLVVCNVPKYGVKMVKLSSYDIYSMTTDDISIWDNALGECKDWRLAKYKSDPSITKSVINVYSNSHAKLQELKAYLASQGGNNNQRSANSGTSSNSSNRNNTSGSSASNGGSSYDSPSSSSGSGTTNEGKDPQADYTGQACSYFTKPAVEADGSRINAYSEGAYVCYGQKMYQCKNKQWAKRGNCIVFSDWQSLKAEVLENRSHSPDVLEGE